jgi:hypothetical protein
MARHTETIEVITRDQRRRRWSLAEKAALVKRTYEPGMSVSLVARQEGVSASLLFQWRKLALPRHCLCKTRWCQCQHSIQRAVCVSVLHVSPRPFLGY